VWDDNKLHAAPPATDGEWCRRVYLDVLGRVPSVTELRDFLTSKEADRKAKLVSKILYDSAYTEDYARNWTGIWTTILIGRNGGLERPHADQSRGNAKIPPATRSLARSRTHDGPMS